MTGFTLDRTLAGDTIPVAHWPLCEVLLMNDAGYPWLILVPRREGLRELYELTRPDRQQWLAESTVLGEWLMGAFQGDKLNIAALGNVVSQLHIHHVVRYRSDPAWPAPVWGHQPRQPYSGEERTKTLQKLLPLQQFFQGEWSVS